MGIDPLHLRDGAFQNHMLLGVIFRREGVVRGGRRDHSHTRQHQGGRNDDANTQLFSKQLHSGPPVLADMLRGL